MSTMFCLMFLFCFVKLLKLVYPCVIPGCTCPQKGIALICSGINMQEIPFRDNNDTEDVPFNSISVSDNLIENLPANALGHYKAKDVNLSHNPLSAMSPRAFERLADTLEILDLSHCQLLTIHWATFRGLSKLRDIRLNNNSLDEIPNGLFDELTVLTSLDLSENSLTELRRGLFDDLKELTQLDLSRNQIYSIEEGTFDHLYRLAKLELNGNKLAFIDKASFLGLDTLKYLNLSENGLSDLTKSAFVFVPRLEIVDLSRNPLGNVDFSSFEDIPALRELYLSHCQLRKVTPGQAMASLELLDVSFNLLESFTFPCGGQVLSSLNIDGNPLVCNCTLNWISSVTQHAKIQGSCAMDKNKVVNLESLALKGCPLSEQCSVNK